MPIKKKKATKKKAPKKKAPKKKALKTHIFFVLDKSASMDMIRSETIEHFNEQIEQVQKDSQDMETSVSLVVFDHNVKTQFFNQPLKKLKPLTLKTYQPSGSTAMYDAVGITIDRAEKEIKDITKKDVAILFIIISDGQENSSKEYNRADIAERIQRLQETKRWTFAYLGANQDLSKVIEDLNLYEGNVQAFVADSQGVRAATAMSVNSTSRYMKSRSLGETQSKNYYESK